MLTLREPIRLKTTRAPFAAESPFARRILENYEGGAMEVTAQQLLFLLGAAPEPAPPGGMLSHSFASTSATFNQQVTLEVVNNVVNRILLAQSPRFSYQDNVYITRVLNRLGIRNVSAFMRQVKAAFAEARAVSGLVRLGRRDVQRFRETVREIAGSAAPRLAVETGQVPAAGGEVNYLYAAVFRRLQSESVYRDMRRWSRSETTGEHTVQTAELLVAEQGKTAMGLPLLQSEGGSRVWQSLTLSHHSYPPPAPPPAEGEAAAAPEAPEARLAAAGLMGLVENVFYSRAERFLRGGGYEVRLAGRVEHSAQNAVTRYVHESMRQAERSHLAPAAGAGEEALAQSVERVENHNRELRERLDSLRVEKALRPAAPATPDSANIMRDALSLLEGKPAEHLERLSEAPPAELRHPAGDPALTEILQSAGPQTRAVYEALLQYQQNPDASLEGGPLRRAGPAELNAELQRIQREQAAAVHPPAPPGAPPSPGAALPGERSAPGTLPPAPMHHPSAEAAVAELLQNAPPATRTLYETLLRREGPAGAAQAAGRLAAAGPAGLHRELERLLHSEAETLHRHSRQSERVEEEGVERVIREAARRLSAGLPPSPPAGTPPPPPPSPPSPLGLVHKRAEGAPPPEDAASPKVPPLSSETRQESESHTRQTVEKRQSETLTRQITATNSEDIAELVNKTLQRELNTLSDRVYSKMEKRLQSERMRRGW